MSEARAPEYGPVLGVATPQANSTVEPEMQLLLGSGARAHTVLTARLTSPLADPRSRLLDYFDRLPATLAQFDIASLAAAGFACTGSSYLVGRQAEEQRLDAAARERGCPVVSAARAISAALAALDAKRIALLSPYPAWLAQASQDYWRAEGLVLTAVAALPEELVDTRAIYGLTSERVQALLAGLDTRGADVVLLSGTGMPTLRTIAARNAGVPIVSSNLCLAWQLECASGGGPALEPWLAADAPWRKRIDAT